jgi:citrate lyase beta subunit
MKLTISENKKSSIFGELKTANQTFNAIYKGDREDRQPIHTVYGGANLFKSNTAEALGKVALRSLLAYASNFIEFSKAFQLQGHESLPDDKKVQKQLINELEKLSLDVLKKHPAGFSYNIYNKVIAKLQREAVEDFRIDFEDGFGNRSDQEEDETAENAAKEVAKGIQENSLPPFIGIRIKPFTEELKERGLRTLDIFLTTLLTETQGKLPNNFVVMLPKVTITEQITALISFFEIIEETFELPQNSLKMEIMVETTQAIIDENGINPLRKFILASKGRCIATHFGTYDYTASNNITAKYQEMDHDVCDFAHYMTKVSLAHTGVWLSDGATNTMPIGPHRGELTPEQEEENKAVVHKAWLKGYNQIRDTLYKG